MQDSPDVRFSSVAECKWGRLLKTRLAFLERYFSVAMLILNYYGVARDYLSGFVS
jgi:hypothetical protein